MANFIDPNNQTLLWNTIQKHPLMNEFFPISNSTSIKRKQLWFKNIIEEIYENIHHNPTREDLIEINKKTLKTMVERLKIAMPTTQITQSNRDILKQDLFETDRSYSRESIQQSKTNNFQRDLEYKQKEYDQLYQRPTPPVVEFENTTDGVIENIDELIQRQLKEREADLAIFPKPRITNSPIKLDISEEENIKIDVLELSSEEKVKKQVSWNMSEAIEAKLVDLTRKYTELLDFLERKIPNFKEEFSLSSETMDL
jgi:hypothetical protein